MNPFSFRKSASPLDQEMLRGRLADLVISLRGPQGEGPDKKIDEFLAAFEGLNVGVFYSGVNGRLIRVNHALANMFGYAGPPEMINGLQDIATQIYEDSSRRQEFIRHVETQPGPMPFLSKVRRENKGSFWIEEWAEAIRDQEGQTTGFIGIVRKTVKPAFTDPSFRSRELKGSEVQQRSEGRLRERGSLAAQIRQQARELETLRRQLENFHIAARGSGEGLWEGHPLPGKPWNSPETPAWYSPQFIALLGFKEHEFPPVLGTWASLLHPDDRDRVFSAMAAHIEGHAPYEVESRLRTKQGEYRWFKGKGQAIFDADGNVIRGGGTIRDITDQKRTQEALRKKHALLTAVIEGTSDVLFVKDHEGRYVLANSSAARLAGTPVEEMVGKTDADLFPGGPHPLFSQRDSDVARQHLPQSFEVNVDDPHGNSRTFLVRKELVEDSEWGSTGILGVARDITFRKVAELTIQEREQQYRAITENAYDLMTEVDEAGRFLYISPNFKEVLGYGPEDLLGKNIFDPVHPEDRSGVMAEFHRGMKNKGSGQSVYRYRHQNGSYLWFESTGRVFQTVSGDLRGVVVSRDVTQRKQAEDALEAIVKVNVAPGSPDFFNILVQELAKALQAPMVLLTERTETPSLSARVLSFWNRDHFEPSSAYECSNGPCEQVFEGERVKYPSDVRRLFLHYRRVQELSIEAYFGIPLVNSRQECVGSLAVMDDQPFVLSSQGEYLLEIFAARAGMELERKRVQEDLLRSQERFRTLYDQTPLIYFTVDPEGRVLSVNRYGAQLLGYRVEELIGKSVLFVIHPDDRDLIQSFLEKNSVEPLTSSAPEFRKVRKDGSIIWVKETIQAIDDHQGAPVWLLSCEDITERKRAEEALDLSEKQLRHKQKMEAIGTLAGGIAHDFNNILGAILGYSELAMTQVIHDQRLKSYLEEVLSAGHRARHLVKQILAFSRRSDQDREAVDLREVIKDVLRMVRASFPTSIEIRTSLDLETAVIYADPTQIQQVVMNLCANAEYAMREDGGTLDISLNHRDISEEDTEGMFKLNAGPYLQLTIRDAGIGIASDELDRIFEPFYTTKQAGEGTGLGLAVVHGIVHNHGGGISVSSNLGQGTMFTILLPRLDVVVPPKTEEVYEWPRGSGRILFVDDEEILVRWGTQFLTHLGYTVVSTVNPHEALEKFRKTPDGFDVVITDQTMPTMTGEALSRALLRIRENVPILLCTGFSHTMSAEKAEQLGIRTFLLKPVDGKSLALAIQKILVPSEKA